MMTMMMLLLMMMLALNDHVQMNNMMSKVRIRWLVEVDHIDVDRHNYYLNHNLNNCLFVVRNDVLQIVNVFRDYRHSLCRVNMYSYNDNYEIVAAVVVVVECLVDNNVELDDDDNVVVVVVEVVAAVVDDDGDDDDV